MNYFVWRFVGKYYWSETAKQRSIWHIGKRSQHGSTQRRRGRTHQHDRLGLGSTGIVDWIIMLLYWYIFSFFLIYTNEVTNDFRYVMVGHILEVYKL